MRLWFQSLKPAAIIPIALTMAVGLSVNTVATRFVLAAATIFPIRVTTSRDCVITLIHPKGPTTHIVFNIRVPVRAVAVAVAVAAAEVGRWALRMAMAVVCQITTVILVTIATWIREPANNS